VPDGTISFETCIETRETDISAWPIRKHNKVKPSQGGYLAAMLAGAFS